MIQQLRGELAGKAERLDWTPLQRYEADQLVRSILRVRLITLCRRKANWVTYLTPILSIILTRTKRWLSGLSDSPKVR